MRLVNEDDMGKTGSDVVTGFQGVITGYCIYLTGCRQVCLSGPAKDDGGGGTSGWYDVDRIELRPDPRVELFKDEDTQEDAREESEPSGGPQDSPSTY